MLKKEELETMSYTEITEAILNDNKKAMKIVDVFKKICELKELSDSEFENRIGDYFDLISSDKNFIILDGGLCDLRKKHTPKVIIEEEEEEENIEEGTLEENEENTENNEEESDEYYDTSSEEDDIDDVDDDLEDFMIVEDDEANM